MAEWFALVDTAQDPSLHPLVMRSSRWQCLVSGEAPPVLAATLPYLVALHPNEPLAARWRAEGQGRNWGLFAYSARPIGALRLHFKKFLTAKLPDGMVVTFRFYDPRVFRTYIRAASPEEREPWFRGVVDRFSVEGDAPGAVHDFHLSDGRLFDGAAPVA